MIQLKTPIVLNTDGTGLWSNRAAAVTVTALDVPYVAEDSDFGELCVHFDTDTWNIKEHGLIYTDDQFEKELCEFLTSIGLDASDVGYSEQGMQGEDYVSLDVGEGFLTSWVKKFGTSE